MQDQPDRNIPVFVVKPEYGQAGTKNAAQEFTVTIHDVGVWASNGRSDVKSHLSQDDTDHNDTASSESTRIGESTIENEETQVKRVVEHQPPSSADKYVIPQNRKKRGNEDVSDSPLRAQRNRRKPRWQCSTDWKLG